MIKIIAAYNPWPKILQSSSLLVGRGIKLALWWMIVKTTESPLINEYFCCPASKWGQRADTSLDVWVPVSHIKTPMTTRTDISQTRPIQADSSPLLCCHGSDQFFITNDMKFLNCFWWNAASPCHAGRTTARRHPSEPAPGDGQLI